MQRCHWQYHQCYDANINGITWLKIHVAPHFNHLDLRNTVVPFMTLLASCATDTNASGIMSCWHQWHKVMLIPMLIVSHIKKSHVAPNFLHHKIRNARVALTMLMTICDATTSVTGIKWLNSHVAAYFGCLDLRNVIVPLTMPSTPQDAANVNGITWPKMSPAAHFNCLDLWNALVILLMLSPSCNTYTSAINITWLSCISFQSSLPKEWNGAIFCC